jgi:hypothetical protein
MSWTDVFPVFTDELIEQYLAKTKPEDELLLDEWCAIARVFNPQKSQHLVVANLFWKNFEAGEGELPPITRKLMKNAKKLGLISRYPPWEHYVLPLLEGAAKLRLARPDVVFRVYLAADLKFLVKDLVAVGCEVMLMQGSSIRHNPGAMWRFLALEEAERWITVTDSDRATWVSNDVERTETIIQGSYRFWRSPYVLNPKDHSDHPGMYRAINAAHFGMIGGLPMRLLIRAFLWHTVKETIPNQCYVRTKKNKIEAQWIYGTKWPSYGFDEWFLSAAIYPRVVFDGVATFYPMRGQLPSRWFALDIEYVTWANPKNEIIYFGEFVNEEKFLENRPLAKSPILKKRLDEKIKPPGDKISLPKKKSLTPLTLVVARYQEDLAWLLKLPKDITVVVYNKGDSLTSERVIERINHLILLPNVGRESDTYLHHVQHYQHGSNDEWTVFCQGDPFPHQPDLIKLLQHRDAWQDVQCLTSGYEGKSETPPMILRVLHDAEWIAGIPVRTEMCSAYTLSVLNWEDRPWQEMARKYAALHGVMRGWSLSGHFLEMCGMHQMAEQAWGALLSRYAIAAVFGVRNQQLSTIPKKCIPKMRKLACGHMSHGYMYERLWLHLFGLPFIGSREAQDQVIGTPNDKLISKE